MTDVKWTSATAADIVSDLRAMNDRIMAEMYVPPRIRAWRFIRRSVRIAMREIRYLLKLEYRPRFYTSADIKIVNPK